MNCWNTLKRESYNEIGNDERECLKISLIDGQSAAELLNFDKKHEEGSTTIPQGSKVQENLKHLALEINFNDDIVSPSKETWRVLTESVRA